MRPGRDSGGDGMASGEKMALVPREDIIMAAGTAIAVGFSGTGIFSTTTGYGKQSTSI